MPIQGTAADILKRAMIDVHAALAAAHPRARMILTVHDELLFEAPKEEADDVAALVKDKMSNAVQAQRAARCRCGDRGELEGGEGLTRLASSACGLTLFPALLHDRPLGAQVRFGLGALVGARAARTRSGMMPSSTSLSRSARSVAERAPASRARTQPAIAASQAATASPAPRVADHDPVARRPPSRGFAPARAPCDRACGSNAVDAAVALERVGVALDGAAPPVEHRLAGFRRPAQSRASMPLSNSVRRRAVVVLEEQRLAERHQEVDVVAGVEVGRRARCRAPTRAADRSPGLARSR